jgi:hypothetical protein
MREHPIPQDVTGYRFHIVGSMTLKQFAEIFLGVIVAVFIYSTNLVAPVKWILILASVGLGAAAAFLPIEERPLDHWIITFVRILYKPTQFFWRRTVKLPEPFSYKPQENQQFLEPEIDLSPARRLRIKEYISSVNTPSEYLSDFTEAEAQKIQNILNVFETQPVISTIVSKSEPRSVPQKPQLEVRVRTLRAKKKDVVDGHESSEVQGIADDQPVQQLDFLALSTNEIIQDVKPITTALSQSRLVKNYNSDVEIPANLPIDTTNAVEEEQSENNVARPQTSEEISAAANPSFMTNVPSNSSAEQQIQVTDAAFNSDLPFPDPPREPNKVVGMVLTPNNELITGAIAEVQTLDRQIVRAVKTNALGQFFISTPLKNGEYVLLVEKPGFQFTPQHLVLTGKLVAPLEIRSL